MVCFTKRNAQSDQTDEGRQAHAPAGRDVPVASDMPLKKCDFPLLMRPSNFVSHNSLSHCRLHQFHSHAHGTSLKRLTLGSNSSEFVNTSAALCVRARLELVRATPRVTRRRLKTLLRFWGTDKCVHMRPNFRPLAPSDPTSRHCPHDPTRVHITHSDTCSITISRQRTISAQSQPNVGANYVCPNEDACMQPFENMHSNTSSRIVAHKHGRTHAISYTRAAHFHALNTASGKSGRSNRANARERDPPDSRHVSPICTSDGCACEHNSNRSTL